MAFPAAPTESGSAKLHFLTTDGNSAAGWFGVTEGPTGTGANTVGFAAIATHVEGDAVAAPGGLNTTGTDVPVVLVAGDDGTNAVPLQLSGSDLKITLDSEAVVLGAGTAEIGKLAAGTAAIGKLAANTGVDIGDVDILTVIPGTGASNLGKAEDAVHGSGDVGVMALVVRNDTLATLAGADGDYAPLQVNASGALFIQEGAALDVSAATVTVDLGANNDVTVTGAALTALQLIDNPVAVLGTATYTETTTSGSIVGAVRNDTLAALAGTDNEIAPLQVNASGALYTVLAAGTAAIGKLAANSGVDIGDVTLTAGTAAFGKLAANSGVDIGDVDVTSIVPGTAATNLGKAEDAAHSSGDVGVMSLAVRNDALAALAGADGEYAPFQVNAEGAVYVRPAVSPTGGCKMFTSVDLDESEEDPTSGATTIYGIYAWNATAAPLWLQMFNTNTVTVGTTAPTNNFMIPANADSDGAGIVLPIPVSGLAYSTALTVAITTGSGTNNGAPGAGDAGIVILYQD